ncbi:MAG TPA: hypothetical protein VHS33_13365 [Sphingomicrobium sp.]|nr:hypothetical protein [Sphingomicrobium sp.]
MRRLPAFAFAVAAAAFAGVAVAAPKTHTMDVSLPDGSVAHIEYVGDVAPKVTFAPAAVAGPGDDWATPFSTFAGFDRMMEQMRRQSEDMIRQAQQMSHQPVGAAPYVASYGNLPAGQTSTTIVSVSNNGVTCTRTTEVVSEGPGKTPKITSNVSGHCGEVPAGPGGATHPA